MPLIFNEQKYLRANPDIVQAIRAGYFQSGEDHYNQFGRKEGRYADFAAPWTTISHQSLHYSTEIIFVIPCFNNWHLTQEAVLAIKSQNPNSQFVFIDNGSTDESKTELPKLGHTIKNEENLFVTYAWNQGLKYALKEKAEIICLCNNDIVPGKDWLDPIFYLFNTRGNEFYIPVSNEHPDSFFDTLDEFNQYKASDLKLQFQEIHFIGFCMFFRRDHIKLFYPIPDTLKVYHGDDYIVDMLNHNNIKAVKVNQCSVWHYHGQTRKIVKIAKSIIADDHENWKMIQKTEYHRRRIGNDGFYFDQDEISKDRCLF